MKVEYGTTSGVYTNTVNNTVLNANKTVGLSGLSASTTYYVRATTYDGNANGTVSTEFSFTTAAPPCTPGKPGLSVSLGSVFWASYADYTARELSVNYTINNTGATDAYAVQITGATSSWGVTLSTAVPVSLGNIAAAGSAGTTLKHHVPPGVTKFRTTISAAASDACGTGYTYP
jgi:hypothetical protein